MVDNKNSVLLLESYFVTQENYYKYKMRQLFGTNIVILKSIAARHQYGLWYLRVSTHRHCQSLNQCSYTQR
jgi:hypothetical protein